MLTLHIPKREFFDEKKQEFITSKETSIVLEHSLVSLSKWESKWHKPFLKEKDEKTPEEIIDYIRCMTITQNVNPLVYNSLTSEHIKQVEDYIQDPMTATTINDSKNKQSREVITAEIIYYWMIALQIPVEFQKWHLNRLLTLIRVCNIKNAPPKKMSKSEIMSRNRALNASRRSSLHTKG